MPSSNLVEVDINVGVEVEVEVGVEVIDLQIKSYHPLRVKSYFFYRVGWVLEIWKLKLISTQVVVEVEVEL